MRQNIADITLNLKSDFKTLKKDKDMTYSEMADYYAKNEGAHALPSQKNSFVDMERKAHNDANKK